MFDPAMFLWTGIVDARMVIEILGRQVPVLHHGKPRRLLDLGGGCGRVSRHLMNVSSLRVALADTNPDHVAWCAEHLTKLKSFRIPPEAEMADIGEGYDCVLAVSVFTHLSSSSFDAWLTKVADALTSRGIGIVTLHGEWSLRYVATNDVLQRYFKSSSDEANKLADELGDRRFVYRPYGREELDAARAGEDYRTDLRFDGLLQRGMPARIFGSGRLRGGGMRGWQDVAVVRRCAPDDRSSVLQ
jgi:SAM-dependent methyltransferase